MATDPNIILGFDPTQSYGPNLGNIANQAAAIIKMRQAQQQAMRQTQVQNALSQLYSPQNIGADGNPTPQAMQAFMAVDPAAGMELQQQQLKTEGMRTEAWQMKRGLLVEEGQDALAVYDDAIKKGYTEQQARQLAQSDYTDGIQKLGKSGLFSQDELSAFNPQFDPVRTRGQLQTYKDRLAAEQKAQEDADKRTHEARQDAETREHDIATETPGARLRRSYISDEPDETGKRPSQYVADIRSRLASGGSIDDAIVQQESGNKPVPVRTVQTKSGPVEIGGRYQISRPLFDKYKQAGETWGNQADMDAASKRALADYRKRYNDDPSDIATAWFSGEGNVAPAGTMQGSQPKREYGPTQEVIAIGPDGKEKQVLAQQDTQKGGWVSADAQRTPLNVKAIAGKEAPEPGDQSVEQTAKLIAGYRMAPLTAFALRSPWGQQVMARVAQLNSSYDATQFTAKNKAVSAFDTGPQGNIVRSQNVAIQHLHLMDQLSDALHNKDEQTINRVKNQLAEEFGNADVTNFDVAKGIVGDEIVKAVISGAGALADRQNAQNQLSRAKSWEQLREATATARKLMAGQLNGLRRQYESSTGLKDFEDKLLPETREELEGLGGSKPTIREPPKFEEGKVYQDAKGNRARYENGAWVPVQ